MCIGGRLGMRLNVEASSVFAEVNGCLLVEASLEHALAFENHFIDLPFHKVGEVISDPILKISTVEIPVDDLIQAFNTSL
jgi:hypothetical protein